MNEPPPSPELPPTATSWQNWSGCVRCEPRRIERASSEAEVRSVVRRAADEGVVLRAVGSGHSQTPLVANDGVVLELDGLDGIVRCDPSARTARVRAGTRLCALGEPLLERGLAMENLGDVDVQALAGAIATGTHGTGPTLPNLSRRVRSLRLVVASGDVVEWNAEEHADELRAARVSLGALGVVTELEVELVPAFRLHERVERTHVEACLDSLDERVRRSRHFEFFWYPARDRVDAKSLDVTEDGPEAVEGVPYQRIDWSARILPSVRSDRFVEMEYAVPAELGPELFRALRARVRERHPDLQWPIEYRTVAGDDSWLSPAYGRPTVTLSVHQDAQLPFAPLFEDLEPLLAEAGGRPHWGKWHSRTAADLQPGYPQWDRFAALRRELDPDGTFLNAHLHRLFVG